MGIRSSGGAVGTMGAIRGLPVGVTDVGCWGVNGRIEARGVEGAVVTVATVADAVAAAGKTGVSEYVVLDDSRA